MRSSNMSNKKVTVNEFAAASKELLGTTIISKAQMKVVSDNYGICVPTAVKYAEKSPAGLSIIPFDDIVDAPIRQVAIPRPIAKPTAPAPEQMPLETAPNPVAMASRTAAVELDATISFIPKVDNSFVPWGNIGDIKKIIKSRLFFPVYLTGMSGNGKTFGIEQTCAMLGREMIRVNFTSETDEDDLFGGFRLVNGETVFQYGPVVEAMKRGAVLLLDEVDLGSNKIMALQSVLEGKGYFIKKRAEWVQPIDGFTVIATANTKGKGSDDGRFIGTNVMNEAFLDRFSVTMYQPYPSEAIEKKILFKAAEGFGIESEALGKFIPNLTMWGDIIRKTFEEGGVDEIVSTRRLVDILKSFSIFQDRGKAIKMAIERFDDETRESFMSLYEKIDAGVGTYPPSGEPGEENIEDEPTNDSEYA